MSDPRERVREFLDLHDEQYGDDSIIIGTYHGGSALNPSVRLESTDLRDVLNELDAADRLLDQQHHCRNGVCT